MKTAETINEIKRSFRAYMDGSIAQSLKEKGAGYKLAWGASIMHLKEMASEYEKNYDLAVNLWTENIRECKILATLLMPAEEMSDDLAEIWMEEVPNQEIAELLAFNLLQNMESAPELAYRWLASDKDCYLICAYNLLSRLFSRNMQPNERGIHEFVDQALVALKSENPAVSHAAANCLIRFAELGAEYETIARSATKHHGFDFI